MVEPAVFLDVLGVAAAFFFSDAIVVFFELEMGNLPGVFVEVCRPAENRFWKWMNVDVVFRHDKGDEESVFVDDDGASAAKSLDHGDFFFADAF